MIQIYKPTAKNTGAAVSFQASDRDKHLYVNFLKQFSWDAVKHVGSFIENKNRPGFYTVLKFNQVEAASLLDAIERTSAFSAYHSSGEKRTQISFAPSEESNSSVFIFKVTQSDSTDSTKKTSFFIPISIGEARLIKEYLIHYLHKSFRRIITKTNSEKQESQAPIEQETPAAEQEVNTTEESSW